MIRRLGSVILVGALVLTSGTLVVLALRPEAVPQVPPAAIDDGVVAAAGDVVWRWSGPSDCNPDTDAIQLQWRVADEDWTGSRIPLGSVSSLHFVDESRGIATGTTSRLCSRGIAITEDGGENWRYRKDNPVLFDAWWVGRRVWGIAQSSGDLELDIYKVRDRGQLVPVKGAAPTMPCDARDGAPSQVGFFTAELGLLLCQQQITGERLIARTTSAGESFERLVDSRPGSGLDGEGEVLALEVIGEKTAWTLFSAEGECKEGQLRRSDSQGAIWDRLPCPSESVGVDLVLDVAFTTQDDGVLLGVKNGNVAMFATKDGGTTWTPSS